MGIVEDWWVATGRHPYVKPPIPNRGRIGVTDFGVLEKVIWPKLLEYMPVDEIAELRKGAKGLVIGVLLRNKSYFDIMSYEQLPMKWESVDLDWVHFDEPPPQAIWNATRARLVDRDGRVWWTLTPLEEPWLHQEIWEKCGVDGRFWGMEVPMYQNPYLSRNAVEHFVREVNADEYEARVLGKFRHLSGRVLKDFTDDYPYVMTSEQAQISAKWDRLMVVDPHEKTPWAVEWYARDHTTETIYRIDELRHDPAEGIEAFGNKVRNIELAQSAPVADHMRIIDTYAAKPTYNKGGNSLIDEIAALTGLTFRVADKSDMDKRLWDLISRYKINPATRIPRLIDLEHCTAARREKTLYVWDKHRTKAGQWAEEKQSPVKKDDHSISCDMYMTAEWPCTDRTIDPLYLFNHPDAQSVEVPDFEGRVVDPEEVHYAAQRMKRRGKRKRGAFA